MKKSFIGASLLAVICAVQVGCGAADDGQMPYETEDEVLTPDEGARTSDPAAAEGTEQSDANESGPKPPFAFSSQKPESVPNVTDSEEVNAPDPEDTLHMFTTQCSGHEHCRD